MIEIKSEITTPNG